MGNNVYAGNLPHSIGEAELKELFEQKWKINSVNVIRDNETGKSRGFAFVDMSTEADAPKRISTEDAAVTAAGDEKAKHSLIKAFIRFPRGF